jgi:hypothetical protein
MCGRYVKEIDEQKVIHKMNELQSISLTCVYFGIDDGTFKRHLVRNNKVFRKSYYIDSQLNKEEKKVEIPKDCLSMLRIINKEDNLSLACVKAGISYSNFIQQLKKRKLKLKVKYSIGETR